MPAGPELDAGDFHGFFEAAGTSLRSDKRNNFRVICLTSDLAWEDVLSRFRGSFTESEQGRFHQLHTTYERLNKDIPVYLYLFQHEETGDPTIFTLNSHDDFRRTTGALLKRTESISQLWLPPDEMGLMQEQLLEQEGSRLTGFESQKFGRERKYEEERRPEVRRRGEYKGDDAYQTLEERKKEYGITPTHLYFNWPTKGEFHFDDEGQFVLKSGDPEYFYTEIVSPAISEVRGLNTAIKSSELKIINRQGVNEIEKQSLEITLNNPLEYDEADAVIQGMKEEGFYPYSYSVDEGSLLLTGKIVDEESGGMISITSDGKSMSVLPRYDSGFDSLLRFYRFVVERVDSSARVSTVG